MTRKSYKKSDVSSLHSIIHLFRNARETPFRSEIVEKSSTTVSSPFLSTLFLGPLPPSHHVDNHPQTRADGLLFFTKSNSCLLSPCSHGILFPENMFDPLSRSPFSLSLMLLALLCAHMCTGGCLCLVRNLRCRRKKRLSRALSRTKSVLHEQILMDVKTKLVY